MSARCVSFFSPPVHHSRMSAMVISTLARLKSSFFSPKDELPCLQHTKDRQVRSERRYAMLLVLQVMIYYAEHENFRVGRLLQGKWKDLSLEAISHYCGLDLVRVKRAFSDLIKKKYVISENQWVRIKGKIVNFPSIKRLTMKIFKELDVLDSLDKMRAYRREKRISREKKDNKKKGSQLATVLKSIIPSFSIKKPISQSGVNTSLSIDKQKYLIKEAQTLHEADKTKSLLEWFAILKAKCS